MKPTNKTSGSYKLRENAYQGLQKILAQGYTLLRWACAGTI